MARSRLDSRRRALHTGEYEKTDGHYEFRWRDKVGVNKKTMKPQNAGSIDLSTV